jgi:hypothetical protein
MSETTRIDAHEWIRRLELTPHPEGGYFRETYRSPLRIQSISDRAEVPGVATRLQGPDQERSASTAIYFLLAGDDFSALHRIASDEVWHFYYGGSLLVSAILPDGTLRTWRLGANLAGGDLPQCVVPAGAWFGAHLAPDRAATSISADEYALVGCTVAPGFEFADFELADRRDLMAAYPEHASTIVRLTR